MTCLPQTPEKLLSIINNTKCIVLKFSASWCGPCKNKTFLQSYYDLKEQYKSNSDVVFLEFDLDNDENLVNDVGLNFKIKSIPAIKIYNKGKLLNEYIGTNYLHKVNLDIQTVINHL